MRKCSYFLNNGPTFAEISQNFIIQNVNFMSSYIKVYFSLFQGYGRKPLSFCDARTIPLARFDFSFFFRILCLQIYCYVTSILMNYLLELSTTNYSKVGRWGRHPRKKLKMSTKRFKEKNHYIQL